MLEGAGMRSATVVDMNRLVANAVAKIEAAEEGAKTPPPAAMSKPRSEAEKRYFAAAKYATDLAAGVQLVERGAAKVSAATAETYAAVYARRLKNAPKKGATAEDLLRGVSRASWHSTRAAIMHHLAKEAREAKAGQEKAYKAGDIDAATAWAMSRASFAKTAADLMAMDAPKERRKRLTKRATVPTDPDWRATVFEAATEAQRPGVAVLWATGCRPAEVESGVDVHVFEKDGRRMVCIDVPGAKVTEKSGQPRRRIIIDAASDPGSALISVMGDADRMTIKRGAAVLNNDFARIRKRLKATGGADWQVAPYSMRHQMSADAKAHFAETMADEDAAVDAVATLLGHLVTRSQGRYGHPSQAKGGTGLIGVSATHAVKKTGSPAPEKSARPAAKPRSDP